MCVLRRLEHLRTLQSSLCEQMSLAEDSQEDHQRSASKELLTGEMHDIRKKWIKNSVRVLCT